MEPIMTATVEPENRSQLSNSMPITLSTENLVKSYSRKGRTVVDQVSISVGTGEIVGLTLNEKGNGKPDRQKKSCKKVKYTRSRKIVH